MYRDFSSQKSGSRGSNNNFGQRSQFTKTTSGLNWRGSHRWDKSAQGGLPVADEAPIGPLVTEMKVEDLKLPPVSASGAKITDVEVVASYSLVGPKSPTIIVPGNLHRCPLYAFIALTYNPGEPALWTPPALPVQLKQDQGEFLRDMNGAYFPDFPMLPTVQSVFALNKSFEPSSVNVVGCASSLGNLLRAARSAEASFRFDVELVGDTLFIVRNAKDEKIPDVRGYGHSFLENFTTYADVFNKTKSHQRIIKYHFAGLDYLVRFESDGCESRNDEKALSQDQRAAMLGPAVKGAVKMDINGTIIPQESVLEVKTRSRLRGSIDLSEHLPRLWVRQIRKLVTGYHERGVFADVQKIDVGERVQDWEKGSQAELRKFAAIVNWLVEEVKRAKHASLEVYRRDTGPLQLREHVGKQRRALPDQWCDNWAGLSLHQSSGEESSDSENDQGYPTVRNLKAPGDSSDEADAGVDYTACDLDCGYCGLCA
ncbi:hypothetical protein BKA67DRAFT_686955 [Truncatella angustata]|uniref:Geranylgeranyl pyrophosphate synthetase n=1 Tax=Truncatella angustata TaxID=152316 RepID=A0A9P8UY88_9PEZI|nr:uncharacterized protein BKA67DRAFT_686955 [Truncatella angustata]KAH6660580.1 hypothetical protein BKA67DRAFT_686955 [Truncatella angustata]KAH8203611.1 hypothetical protein TruAng_002244 [Truncatella angustata]